MPLITNLERRQQKRFTYSAIMTTLIIGVPVLLFPYIWMLSGSFKTIDELFRLPPTIIPQEWHMTTYSDLFATVPFGQYILNSLILSFGTILVQVPISSLAAYALSKLRPRGGRLILLFFLATLMIPFEAILIPIYIMMVKFPVLGVNFINTPWALWLPFSAWAFALFLLKNSFDRIPRELLEAARIDGAGELHIFWALVLPLSRPVLAVVSVFTFVAVYNQFLLPLVMLPDPENWSTMVSLHTMQFGNFVPWNQIMAAAVLTSIPPIIVFVLFQRYISQGFATTGLRG